jgi:hypothetical protein
MRPTESRLRQDRLLRWLTALPEGASLPRMTDIGQALGFPATAVAYYVCGAFEQLAGRGIVVTRSGTRSEARGHRIVRVIATGRVHRTPDCPFELPQDGAGRASAGGIAGRPPDAAQPPSDARQSA